MRTVMRITLRPEAPAVEPGRLEASVLQDGKDRSWPVSVPSLLGGLHRQHGTGDRQQDVLRDTAQYQLSYPTSITQSNHH